MGVGLADDEARGALVTPEAGGRTCATVDAWPVGVGIAVAVGVPGPASSAGAAEGVLEGGGSACALEGEVGTGPAGLEAFFVLVGARDVDVLSASPVWSLAVQPAAMARVMMPSAITPSKSFTRARGPRRSCG